MTLSAEQFKARLTENHKSATQGKHDTKVLPCGTTMDYKPKWYSYCVQCYWISEACLSLADAERAAMKHGNLIDDLPLNYKRANGSLLC